MKCFFASQKKNALQNGYIIFFSFRVNHLADNKNSYELKLCVHVAYIQRPNAKLKKKHLCYDVSNISN